MDDVRFSAIVKAVKTWSNFLKGYKHNILIFTDYNKIY